MEAQSYEDDSTPLMPSWHARNSLLCAMGIWEEFIEENKCKKVRDRPVLGLDLDKTFFQIFLEPAHKIEKLNPNESIEEMLRFSIENIEKKEFPLSIEKLIRVVIAYVIQTFREESGNNLVEAWQYATRSSYWSGVLVASSPHLKENYNPAAVLAKRRHRDSQQLIDFAIEFWKEHIDPTLSAQKAANELILAVPLSHKKLAEIVSSEKKKLKK